MSTDPDRNRNRPAGEAVLVVTLGKSSGASTVAAGLAVAKVRDGQRVVLAELDPAGGDLAEHLVFQGRPTAGRIPPMPPGARELTDHIEATALSPTGDDRDGDDDHEVLRRFLVGVGKIGDLAVLLGDPLVDGARRSAEVLGPRLGRMTREIGYDTVIIDGGRWSSADADRLDGIDLVYAVVEGSTVSQNHRCVAEAQSLWRRLRARNPSARMVVVITRSDWPAAQALDLYQYPPGAEEPGYRAVSLELDRDARRAAVRLATGRWASVTERGLAPFAHLARPIGRGRRSPPPQRAERRQGPVDEYAYLDTGTTPARAPGPARSHRPARTRPGTGPGTGWSPAPVARPTWPFTTTTPPPASRADRPATSDRGGRPPLSLVDGATPAPSRGDDLWWLDDDGSGDLDLAAGEGNEP